MEFLTTTGFYTLHFHKFYAFIYYTEITFFKINLKMNKNNTEKPILIIKK